MGTEANNRILGQTRADAVRALLVEKLAGQAMQIRVFSLGKSQPAVESRKREAANRRVEIYVNRRTTAFELPPAVVKPPQIVTMPPPVDTGDPVPAASKPPPREKRSGPIDEAWKRALPNLDIPRVDTLEEFLDHVSDTVTKDPHGIVAAMTNVAEALGLPRDKAREVLRSGAKAGTEAAIKAAIKKLVELSAGSFPETPEDSVILAPKFTF